MSVIFRKYFNTIDDACYDTKILVTNVTIRVTIRVTILNFFCKKCYDREISQ